jgi:hypothetical protein
VQDRSPIHEIHSLPFFNREYFGGATGLFHRYPQILSHRVGWFSYKSVLVSQNAQLPTLQNVKRHGLGMKQH